MTLKSEIEQRTWEVVEKHLNSLGYELVDVEFAREGKKRFLRIFIDKEGGVTIDDCVNVSRLVSPLLEVEGVEDSIRGSYNLEVSSPGLFRKLKREEDYEKSVGKRVKITTYLPVENEKVFIGTLKENLPEAFVVEFKGKKFMIEKENVARINLEPELNF